jgi:hypothetical protein
MKTAKLERVDDLDRMVLPIADRRWVVNVGVRMYTTVTRLRAGQIARARLAAADPNGLAFAECVGRANQLLPFHRGNLLRGRFAGFSNTADHFVELRLDERSAEWDALVLLRGPDEDGLVAIIGVQRSPDILLRAIVPALVPIARRLGGRRLQIAPLHNGWFARECEAAGFIRRPEANPLFATAFTDAGIDALHDFESWQLTSH